MIQFAFFDLIRMSFHLVHVPIDTQIPTVEEASLGCIQPKRHTARERLLILPKRSKCVEDFATILRSNDAGVDGKDAEIRVL